MNPYIVIGLLILGFYVAHRLALARYHKTRDESWLMTALLMMGLETEARKARDRRKTAGPAHPPPSLQEGTDPGQGKSQDD